MRIIDEKNKKTITSITIMLTPAEASELIGKMEKIVVNSGDHIHVNDREYKREITVAIYTNENQQYFSKEIIEILNEN
jgi:hypothetical protein